MQKSKLIDLSGEGEEHNHFVLLFRKRGDGRRSTWICRLWLPPNERASPRNPYAVGSLDTTDRTVARRKAYEWRREYEARRNPSLEAPAFRSVAEAWITNIGLQREQAATFGEKPLGIDQYRRWKSVTRRYLIPYFGDQPVNSITPKLTSAYGEWRRNFYVSGPGAREEHVEYERNGRAIRTVVKKSAKPARSTVSKDVEAFNKIIAFAKAQHSDLDWTSDPRLEKATSGAREPSPRQRFTPPQVKHLFKKASEWVTYKAKSQKRRFDRAVLSGMIEFLWLTGARTSEALVLSIGDVIANIADEEYEIPNRGPLSRLDLDDNGETYFSALDFKVSFPGIKRVSHKRIAEPRVEFEAWYASHAGVLKHRFLPHNEECDFEGLSPHLPLFPTWDGERCTDMGHRHEQLLNFATSKKYPNGLRLINGATMSLSCWRHTYASEMIEAFARTRQPNMVSFLARNMGTSEDMIGKYYGHLLPAFAKQELRI